MVAMLRPTLTTGLYVQMLGRGTRMAAGKVDCLVLDFAGNIRRNGPADAVSVTTHKRDGGAARNRPREGLPPTATPHVAKTPLCPECGYESGEEARPEAEVRQLPMLVPVMGGEADLVPRRFVAVTAWASREAWQPANTAGRPMSAATTTLREWVALEHSGFAAAACGAVVARDRGAAARPVPATVSCGP